MAFKQLPLNIYNDISTSFASYIVSEQNQQLICKLFDLIDGKIDDWYIYIYSDISCGKTHLLKACCQKSFSQSKYPIFIDLGNMSNYSPDILCGLDTMSFVCLDNIHCVVNNPVWEEQIFNMYNYLSLKNIPLVVSGSMPINKLNFSILDLKSRLCSGLSYKLYDVDDNDKITIMKNFAKNRGFFLTDKIIHNIIYNNSRSLNTLLSTVRKLGDISLSEGKKPNINHLKKINNN